MKNTLKIVIVFVLIALLISACVPGDVVAGEGVGGSIVRNVDKEAGVVCYIYTAQGTISCVPIDQTCLDD